MNKHICLSYYALFWYVHIFYYTLKFVTYLYDSDIMFINIYNWSLICEQMFFRFLSLEVRYADQGWNSAQGEFQPQSETLHIHFTSEWNCINLVPVCNTNGMDKNMWIEWTKVCKQPLRIIQKIEFK